MIPLCSPAKHRGPVLRRSPRFPPLVRSVRPAAADVPAAQRRARSRERTVADRSRGAAATELVLLLPVLVLFFMGLVDFGRAVETELVVTNAARVGAEYGATHRYSDATYPDWRTRLIQAVVDEAASPDIPPDKVEVTVAVTPGPDGQKSIRVTVQVPFRMMTAWPGLPEQVRLAHTVAMKQFR